nr:abhydrolase domain-containing protein mpah [Quercus suber]
MATIFEIQEHTLPTCHIREYPHATIEDQEDVLHLAIKQYTPIEKFKASQEVTVIGAHANGFPKVLNMACVASWLDHPRDLLLMVNHFRAHMKRPIIGIGHSMGGNNLVNLSLMHPRLFTTLILMDPVIQRRLSAKGNFGPATMSAKRRDRWPSRDAARKAFLRSKFYQTWDSRVFDRWITYGLRDLPTALHPTAPVSRTPPIVTPDASTAGNPSHAATEREVTLTTTKHQEVFTFIRPNFATPAFPDPATSPDPSTHPDVDLSSPPIVPFYSPAVSSTFHKLPFLRSSVLYLYASESHLSSAPLRADREAHTGIGAGGSGGFAKGRVQQHMFQGVGHLIPMEVVDDAAELCAGWVEPELRRWRVGEEAQRRAWAAVPREQKTVLSEEFITRAAVSAQARGTMGPTQASTDLIHSVPQNVKAWARGTHKPPLLLFFRDQLTWPALYCGTFDEQSGITLHPDHKVQKCMNAHPCSIHAGRLPVIRLCEESLI